MVEHEEGAKVALLAGADGSADTGSGAFGLLDGADDLCDGSGDGHFGGCEVVVKVAF